MGREVVDSASGPQKGSRRTCPSAYWLKSCGARLCCSTTQCVEFAFDCRFVQCGKWQAIEYLDAGCDLAKNLIELPSLFFSGSRTGRWIFEAPVDRTSTRLNSSH